jgi:chromosome segregation ATPase
LKLLACQRSTDNWTTVPNEESISADEASSMNPGTLVLVELTANKQVQKIEEASRKLASTLNNLSRSLEKSKSQEDEIEQWKQSLTYQSQELNRREMELEARTEQLQQLEEDFEQLEQQRQEIDGSKEESARLREEVERSRQELESAWEQLRGEMRRLEERQAELQDKPTLDATQAQTIQSLLSRLSSTSDPTGTIRDQLNLGFEAVNGFQSLLDGHWQALEQSQANTQQLQQQVDQRSLDLQSLWQNWHQAQSVLEQARAELKSQQDVLANKQEQGQVLNAQLRSYEALYQQVYQLADVSDQVVIGQKVDLEALEKMPLDALQSSVQDLQREFEKMAKLISMQEEELVDKEQSINELREQIKAASEYDRLRLENELTDEEESYRILNEPLIGQRQVAKEREAILKQHQGVLARRQGKPVEAGGERHIDLGPVLTQVDTLRKQQAEAIAALTVSLEQIGSRVQQLQEQVGQQAQQQDGQRNDLKRQEQELNSQRQALGEALGRMNLYRDLLQPVQDNLNSVRQKLETIAGSLAQFQETNDSQIGAVRELSQVLQALTV